MAGPCGAEAALRAVCIRWERTRTGHMLKMPNILKKQDTGVCVGNRENRPCRDSLWSRDTEDLNCARVRNMYPTKACWLYRAKGRELTMPGACSRLALKRAPSASIREFFLLLSQ